MFTLLKTTYCSLPNFNATQGGLHITITLVELQTPEGCICRKSARIVVFYLCAINLPLRMTLKMWRFHSGLRSKVPVTPFKVSLRLRHGDSMYWGRGACTPKVCYKFLSFCRSEDANVGQQQQRTFLKSLHQKSLRLGAIRAPFLVHMLVFCRFVVVLSLYRFANWDNLIHSNMSYCRNQYTTQQRNIHQF